ncbi:hypothetical protein [Jidongwangia harbinensis]|uniref:hypothetical protein n=1 Tax=Jidongwangia harbinensis TaxID=2878561 RepID=UPI001CDA1917|nr:hypothetical protein [Jidongwangia harbinensis]MCA2217947.1 hypothetical protein [Jidongwangia harbinensis]
MNRPVRALLGAAVLLGAAAGCAAGEPDTRPLAVPSGPATAPSAAPPTAPSAPPPATPSVRPPVSAGTDVKPCYDGTCEIQVSRRTVIPLRKNVGLAGLTVSITGPDRVRVVAEDGMMQAGGTTGTRLTLNRLRIEVLSVADGKAVLRLSPT